jgi:hypothetical protein
MLQLRKIDDFQTEYARMDVSQSLRTYAMKLLVSQRFFASWTYRRRNAIEKQWSVQMAQRSPCESNQLRKYDLYLYHAWWVRHFSLGNQLRAWNCTFGLTCTLSCIPTFYSLYRKNFPVMKRTSHGHVKQFPTSAFVNLWSNDAHNTRLEPLSDGPSYMWPLLKSGACI